MHSFYFLGTPHRGSDPAIYMNYYLTFSPSHKEFPKELLPNSATVRVRYPMLKGPYMIYLFFCVGNRVSTTSSGMSIMLKYGCSSSPYQLPQGNTLSPKILPLLVRYLSHVSWTFLIRSFRSTKRACPKPKRQPSTALQVRKSNKSELPDALRFVQNNNRKH